MHVRACWCVLVCGVVCTCTYTHHTFLVTVTEGEGDIGTRTGAMYQYKDTYIEV